MKNYTGNIIATLIAAALVGLISYPMRITVLPIWLWAYFGLYVGAVFMLGGYFSTGRRVAVVAVLACAVAIGVEVYHLNFPRPREMKDFRTAYVLTAWLGALVGALWARHVILLRRN